MSPLASQKLCAPGESGTALRVFSGPGRGSNFIHQVRAQLWEYHGVADPGLRRLANWIVSRLFACAYDTYREREGPGAGDSVVMQQTSR